MLTKPVLPLVVDPERITPDWLSAVLHADGTLPESVRVAAIERSTMSGGAIAHTLRLRPTYDAPAPDAPTSVVAKFPAVDEQPRALATLAGLYIREVRFYQEFADDVGMRVPHCHAAYLDPENNGFALVLEDVTDATEHDQDDPYPPEDVLLALRQLALLHRSHWNSEKLAESDWLNRLDGPALPGWEGLFRASWQEFTARDEVILDQDLRELGNLFCTKGFSRWLGSAGGPRTLTHADFHVSNMLFRNGTRGRELVTLDWQLAMRSSPMLDVAYFLGRMPTDLRRAEEQDLARRYHEALAIPDYAWPDCWTDYRRWAWYGLVSSLIAVIGTPMTPEEAHLYGAKVTRYLTQAADLNSADFLR